jgi:diguanylate cyclase (GGDEF)-like protein/PAS domain S-box-containing protein
MIRLRAPISRRHASFVTYAGSFAATWGLLGLEARVRVSEVAVAFALQVVVGLALLRARRDRSRWLGVAGVIIFLGSVALLRDGVGPTAGYTSLMLLPVFWAALHNRRTELALALGGAAVLLFTPLLLIGGAHYPASGWRTGALWIVIAAGLGNAVLSLVDQLRSSNQRHRLLADNSTDLVARFAPDGSFTYASAASYALLGCEPRELVGQSARALMHPEDSADLAQRRAHADATASTVVDEFRLRHRDGRWIWFEATIRTVRDSNGVVTERQAALRPIEERKRLQIIVERQRDDATNLLAEQSALRHVATLVAAGAQPDAVFDAMAEQLAQLFDAMLGSVVRFDASTGAGEYVGAWSASGTQLTGHTIDLTGATATATVYQLGHSAQVIRYPDHSADRFLDEFSLGGGFAAPISVGGKLWGAVGVAVTAGRTVPADAQERLSSFAELAAMAISSTEAMETLSREAATDPLTGLANYRAFHERLGAEVERSSRHGRLLSVAVLDLDHFKQVNDNHGHLIGDRVLAEVATRLANAVRTGELVGRIGGEEFAWLMPETAQADAYSAAERVRQAIKSTAFDTAGALTMSIGVCSNEHAETAEDLLGCADQALYRAKQGGRDLTFVYDADRSPTTAGAARDGHRQRLSVPMSNSL